MSVYNRRLFRRNARNALNNSAGISAVDPRLAANAARQNRMSAMMTAANPRPSRALSRGNRAGISTLPTFGLQNLLGPEGQRLLNASRTPVSQAAPPNDMTISEILAGAARMDDRFNQRIANAASQVPPIPPGPAAPNVSGVATNLGGSRAIPDPLVGVQPGIPDPLYSGIPASGVTGTATNLDGSRAIPDPALAPPVGFPTLAEEEAAKAAGQRRDQVGFPTLAEEEAAKAAGRREDGIDFPDRSIPDPEAGVTDSDVTTGAVAEGEEPGLSQQTDPARATATAVAETVGKIDPENTTLEEGKGTQAYVTGLIEDMVDKGDSEGASDALLTAFGQLDPDDTGKLSTDERLAKMKETISKFFGRDLEAEKSVDGMNLAMLGFLIAAGDSPNALKNIAQGSVQGLKEIKKTKEARMAREDKLNGLVVSTVLGREDKESDQAFRERLQFNAQKHDLTKFSLQDASVMKRFAADLSFKGWAKDTDTALALQLKNADIDIVNAKMKNALNMQIDRLASNERIAKDGNSSREAIAAANRESAEIRAVIGNMEKGWGVALLDGKNRGLKGEELLDYVNENGNRFAAESLLTGPDSLKRATTTLIPTIMKEQDMTYEQAANSLYNNPTFQAQHAKDIEALEIPLVEVRDDSGPTGDKVIVGTLISENTGDPVRSRNVIKAGGFYRVVQSDGTSVRFKKRGGNLGDIKVDEDGQPLE